MTTDISSPVADIESILDQYPDRVQMHVASWVFARQCGVWATPRQILTQLGEEAPPECHDDLTRGVHLLLEAASESTRCDGERERLPTITDRPIRAGDGGQRVVGHPRQDADVLVPQGSGRSADSRSGSAAEDDLGGAA